MINSTKAYIKNSEKKQYGPHLWQWTAVREAAVLGTIGFGIFMAYQLSVIFTPVVLALLSAYLIHPVVDFCQARLGLHPKLIVALLFIFTFVMLAVLGIWVGPILVEQFRLFAEAQPAYNLAVTEKPTFPRKFNYSHIFYRPMTEIAGGLTHQAIEAEIGHSSSVILLSFYN